MNDDERREEVVQKTNFCNKYNKLIILNILILYFIGWDHKVGIEKNIIYMSIN